MKLSAREDIDVPQDRAFGAVTTFDHWERAALRSGASVVRTDTLATTAPGMTWDVGFSWRGRPRSLTIRLTDLDPPQALRFAWTSPSFEGWMTIDVVKMGPRRTRLAIKIEARPRTLASRLFLQSVKLARARVTRRFEAAVAQFAAAVVKRQTRHEQ